MSVVSGRSKTQPSYKVTKQIERTFYSLIISSIVTYPFTGRDK